MALSGPTRGTARIAILTITDEEFVAARAVFRAHAHVPASPYFVDQISNENSYKFVVRRIADRTNHPSREAVGQTVEDFRPEIFILVGTAGGIHGRDGVLLGDVVIADYVEYCEIWKLLPEKHAPRRLVFDQPYVFLRETFAEPLRHDRSWIGTIAVPRPTREQANLIRSPRQISVGRRKLSRLTSTGPQQVFTSDTTPKAIIGNIVSGEKIWGDPTSEEQVRILNYYDKAVALEMESMGVGRGIMAARTGVSYNPQYLVIRGISDLVNCAGNEQTRRQWTSYATASAAAFACQLAHDYLAVPQLN